MPNVAASKGGAHGSELLTGRFLMPTAAPAGAKEEREGRDGVRAKGRARVRATAAVAVVGRAERGRFLGTGAAGAAGAGAGAGGGGMGRFGKKGGRAEEGVLREGATGLLKWMVSPHAVLGEVVPELFELELSLLVMLGVVMVRELENAGLPMSIVSLSSSSLSSVVA